MQYVYRVLDGHVDGFVFLNATSLGYRVKFETSANTMMIWKCKAHSRHDGLPSLCNEERSFLDYQDAWMFAIKQLREKASHFFYANQDCEKKMMALIASKALK